MTETNKLKALIMKNGFTQESIAKAIGVTVATFNYKLHNKVEFKASEIKKLSRLLYLSALEVDEIFFAENVEWNSTQQRKVGGEIAW